MAPEPGAQVQVSYDIIDIINNKRLIELEKKIIS